MPDYPNAHVQVEDVDHKERELMLLCRFDKTNDRSGSVCVIAWYDYERQCGLSHILSDEGEELIDHLALELREVLLDYCREVFRLDDFVREYLKYNDCEQGRIFRSREPIDWDTIAKDQRMDREREDT